MQVGKEFGSVEALWSQFENFMVRPDEEGDSKQNGENEDDHENENEHEHEHEYEHGDEEGDTEYNWYLFMLFSIYFYDQLILTILDWVCKFIRSPLIYN